MPALLEKRIRLARILMAVTIFISLVLLPLETMIYVQESDGAESCRLLAVILGGVLYLAVWLLFGRQYSPQTRWANTLLFTGVAIFMLTVGGLLFLLFTPLLPGGQKAFVRFVLFTDVAIHLLALNLLGVRYLRARNDQQEGLQR